MNFYVDIKVLPDEELSPSQLMNILFAKLHRALVTLNVNSVGVNFPEAKTTAGSCLRLHGPEAVLTCLMEGDWIKGLKGYVHIFPVYPIPVKTLHIRVRRVQSKTTASRLRRAIRRQSMSEEEAQQLFEKRTRLRNPFIRLDSSSTGQKFPLFIEQGEPQSHPVSGTFNSYGLSREATTPWF